MLVTKFKITTSPKPTVYTVHNYNMSKLAT